MPTGVQNVAESAVDFVEDGIIMQTIGAGRPASARPFLITLFIFIFFCNIFEVIPVVQMPANARIALPMFLALLVYVDLPRRRRQGAGPVSYLKNIAVPAGRAEALYILVTPIEFVSTFLVRPFSLAVRLFANMLAGHLLLVTFAVLTRGALDRRPVRSSSCRCRFALLVFLTAFEVLVAFLQAFIFTILAACTSAAPCTPSTELTDTSHQARTPNRAAHIPR